MNFWLKFKQQKSAYYSLILFVLICLITLCLNFISNDKPLFIKYNQKIYLPLINDYEESTFGGNLAGPADYLDPYIKNIITDQQKGNFSLYPINKYSADTINYFHPAPNPSPPSIYNFLGTDDAGRDVLARILYALRLSLWFGIIVAGVNVILGSIIGAIQGYYANKVDLFCQRIIEIWGNIPEIYVLIIIASIFKPNIYLILILFCLFSWIGTSEYIRLECLKIRQMDYIKAAKVIGLKNRQIIFRHVLPNVIHPIISLLPFKIIQAIVGLTALDFLGLGLPPNTASFGSLLSQAKNNLEAWWISIPTVAALVVIIILLTFIGDGLNKILRTQY